MAFPVRHSASWGPLSARPGVAGTLAPMASAGMPPAPPAQAAHLPRTTLAPRSLVTETALVLGVSLGASAIWSLLRIVDRLTQHIALNQQTTTMNNSVTPDRPWLDLAYQLTGIGLGVVPALLALCGWIYIVATNGWRYGRKANNGVCARIN